MNDEASNKPQRAIHHPITINIEDVEDLATVRTLPPDTLMTVNLKMDRAMARKIMANFQKQLDGPGEIDFIAVTLTGVV